MRKVFNIVAVDDDIHFLLYLKESLKYIHSVEVIKTMQHGNSLIEFLMNHHVDIVLLDIDLPGMNGLELAKSINLHFPEIKIIFLTGEAGFAVEAFSYYPVDYILKPISQSRLQNSIIKIINKKQEKGLDRGRSIDIRNVRLGVTTKKGFSLVYVSDICYIESTNRKVMIVLKNNSHLETNDSLKSLEVKLRKYNFYRTHQSFLVPLHLIKTIQPDDYMSSYNIELYETSQTIKLSKHKYKELVNLLSKENILL
ncbi:LytR/AlgR family response regulator transcription factor [Bacillus nitroreducens]